MKNKKCCVEVKKNQLKYIFDMSVGLFVSNKRQNG